MSEEEAPRSSSSTNVRLSWIERDLQTVSETVKSIDRALRFPEESALGRQLLERSQRNEQSIFSLKQDVDELQSVVDQQAGVIKFLRMASVILGIIVAIFTLFQVAQ